jgi:hypothetical protein
MNIYCRELGALALWIVLAGCGSNEPRMAKVEGKVTLDGKPLARGLIKFLPNNRHLTSTASIEIENGEFKGKVFVGEWRVAVTAPKVVGQAKVYQTSDSPTRDVVEELIPEKYNVMSRLSADVKPGENKLVFELHSK